MKTKLIGLTGTIIISSLIMLFFYSAPLSRLNDTFFAADGDGLKDYYNTVYFLKYDTSYFHSQSMNYPHGEHVFFTGNQPSISFILKFINTHIVDISDKTVGIMNLAMLLSVVLGAVFLYLLLIHFNLPVAYSLLISIGITFLSPQLARMPGHFSLSYVFAIPAMLYLMAKFHQKNRYLISTIIGLFVLWALGTHIYMLGFHASIILLYWIYTFALSGGSFRKKENYYHLALQFIIPFLLFLVVTLLTDTIADRTAYPWGFLYFRAYPESVFLPLGKPYAQFLYQFSNFRYVNWEGIAWVGLVASAGFLLMVVLFFKNIFKKRYVAIANPSNHPMLNIFFWASLVMLLYSFGLPFIIGDLKHLVHYIGPLKQMRGIARFSWLFFYVMNIFIFYHIWHLRKSGIHSNLWKAILGVSVSLLMYDAYLNVDFWSKYVNNTIPALSDRHNETEENQWVQLVDNSQYQATIPIPYFHVGSENTWVDARCGITRPTYIVSWKTGLPTMGVMLSRTSISQTLDNLQLLSEAYRTPALLPMLDSSKNFLLVVRDDCDEIPPSQRELINKSRRIHESQEFSLYSLPFDSLLSAVKNPYPIIAAEMQEEALISHNGYYTREESQNFFTEPFEEADGQQSYFTGGSNTQNLRNSQWMYVKDIPAFDPEQEYIFSFWVKGIRDDLVLRSRLELEFRDAYDHGYDRHTPELFRHLKIIDGDWGLIERRFQLRDAQDMIRWRIRNADLRRSECIVAHVIIRPVHTDIYKQGEGWIMKNNRFYIP